MGFEALYGHEPVKNSLIKALSGDRISNAYVFEGAYGTGKRLCAEIFARALVCESEGEKPCDACPGCKKAKSANHPDIFTLAPANDKASIGVEDVREQILSEVYLTPYLAKRRVFLVKEGDLLSVGAQNALLKILEEPPSYVTFVICVTKQDKLLSTILSRSQILSFFSLSYDEVETYLNQQFGNETDHKPFARLSKGSIGTALLFKEDAELKERFQKSIEHLLMLTQNAASVRKTADFLISEREHITHITDFLLTFLRDAVFLLSGMPEHVIYQSELSNLRVFVSGMNKKSLVSAFDRVTEFQKRLSQNLNYSASVLETVMRIWEDFHDKGSGHQI